MFFSGLDRLCVFYTLPVAQKINFPPHFTSVNPEKIKPLPLWKIFLLCTDTPTKLELYWLYWLSWLAGKSKMDPLIFISYDHSFNIKTIETRNWDPKPCIFVTWLQSMWLKFAYWKHKWLKQIAVLTWLHSNANAYKVKWKSVKWLWYIYWKNIVVSMWTILF